MLTTNTEFLHPELMDVVRLYGENVPDIAHNFLYAQNNFINTVMIGGREYDFCEQFVCAGELEFKRYAKRFAKLAVYEALRAYTGRSMPWGALTGIRPTKLAYAEQDAGRDFEPLFEKFGVCAENIALVRAVLDAQKGIYAQEEGAADLYIGGGTPLVLSEERLRRVLDAAEPFARDTAEYTVEAGRPDVFTPEKLQLLRDYGVTRICVNPQSFCDATLERIGRRHTSADIYRAYEMAQKFGFEINFDLIAGLTGESCEEFEGSVDKAIALSPDNITVHTLCLKKGSRLKEEESFLNVERIQEMIAYSRRRLGESGYVPYYMYRQKYMAGNCENTGWTKPGKACVYNVDVMEEITDNLACGANAVGKKIFPHEGRIERQGAPKDIPTYIKKIDGIIAGKRALFGGK